jgi:hypothetical protein
MGVTNGFLRLSPKDLEKLRRDPAAFEERCRDYDQPDYLDMDKAGWELVFVLDPEIESDDADAPSPYPALAAVLCGGEIIHADIDLGYGPAQLVANDSIAAAVQEFTTLSKEKLISMALENELLGDILMCDVDEETIGEYHWPYLRSLVKFLAEAQQKGMVVLRY